MELKQSQEFNGWIIIQCDKVDKVLLSSKELLELKEIIIKLEKEGKLC